MLANNGRRWAACTATWSDDSLRQLARKPEEKTDRFTVKTRVQARPCKLQFLPSGTLFAFAFNLGLQLHRRSSNVQAAQARVQGIGCFADSTDHRVLQILRPAEACPNQGCNPARACKGMFFVTFVTQGARRSLAKVAQYTCKLLTIAIGSGTQSYRVSVGCDLRKHRRVPKPWLLYCSANTPKRKKKRQGLFEPGLCQLQSGLQESPLRDRDLHFTPSFPIKVVARLCRPQHPWKGNRGTGEHG